MNKPDYMIHVVESQTVEDINGIRCYHCYQLLGDLHGKGCMAPAGTAIDELGDAVMKEISRLITGINHGLEALANWIQKICNRYDKI